MEMNFTPYALNNYIDIGNIYSCFYMEHSNRHHYTGESHDFWEIVYVDKGDVNANTSTGYYKLNQGNILVHSPNEYHCLESTGTKPPNLFIVTFESDSEDMNFFHANKQFSLNNMEQSIVARLMNEGMNTFQINSFPLVANENQLYGSEQLFKICLQQLLLTLIRSSAESRERPTLTTITRENLTTGLVNQLIDYIDGHLSDKLTLEQLCSQVNIGKTQLNIMFKRATGCGLIAYVNKTRIEHAKKYIREETYNFSEIGDMLGYSSIHYFSRHFKKEAGMSPSDYAKTITARTERME